jgi:hypothetical protein
MSTTRLGLVHRGDAGPLEVPCQHQPDALGQSAEDGPAGGLRPQPGPQRRGRGGRDRLLGEPVVLGVGGLDDHGGHGVVEPERLGRQARQLVAAESRHGRDGV